jgi:hypothetical protein
MLTEDYTTLLMHSKCGSCVHCFVGNVDYTAESACVYRNRHFLCAGEHGGKARWLTLLQGPGAQRMPTPEVYRGNLIYNTSLHRQTQCVLH